MHGDTVNLAQRLERLNKKLETGCLMCGGTFGGSSGVEATPMGSIRVRGRDRDVEVFALTPSSGSKAASAAQ